MTRCFIIIYRNSVLATLVSIAGTILLILGLSAMFYDTWYTGLTLMTIGLGLMLGAYFMAKRVGFKKWIKQLKAKGVIDELPNSEALCIKLYQSNPCKRTLAFIHKCNTEAADYISKFIVTQKHRLVNCLYTCRQTHLPQIFDSSTRDPHRSSAEYTIFLFL